MTIADGRKALITGGASGFGLAVATALDAAGAAVALLDVSDERLAAAADVLPGAATVRADVRSPGEVRAAVREATEALGGLDTLVISAGVIHIKPLDEVDRGGLGPDARRQPQGRVPRRAGRRAARSRRAVAAGS